MTTAMPALTLAERSVLITCTEAFGRRAYQPPEHLAAAAGALLERGLLEKDPEWPDTLIVTDEGQAAYDAVRWGTCRTCALEIYPAEIADHYAHADGQDHGHAAKPILP